MIYIYDFIKHDTLWSSEFTCRPISGTEGKKREEGRKIDEEKSGGRER